MKMNGIFKTLTLVILTFLPACSRSSSIENSQSSINDSHIAPKPLYRDPVYDGPTDPVVIWNASEQKWFMFYTSRRANVPGLSGVTWVHGSPIGIAESADGGVTWTYRQNANINYAKGNDTYWAPEVIEHNGIYHLYLTYVPGIFENWEHPRDILHLTSKNLLDWQYESTLKLACNKVIDACVFQLADGTWRLWYNNEKDAKSIYYAESGDLYHWQDKGKAVTDKQGEGPKVFRFEGFLWMVVDNWDGLGVYRSTDALNWTRQEKNLLQIPGSGTDDTAKGHHPDIVVNNGHAYLFYFTHPDNKRRSSIQVTELHIKDDWLTCDRNTSTYIDLKPTK